MAAEANDLEREPAKILRTTFSKQTNSLAAKVDTSLIPPGILRNTNYLDATADYWKVADIHCPVESNTPEIAYASVFNYMAWRPAWWGNVINQKVTFSNMPRGVVYLPTIYKNKKLIPVGYPYALGYNNEKVLKPDLGKLRQVTLPWQDKYLIYRPGKNYKLYYWDHQWKLLGEQTAGENTQELTFSNVPSDALLLLVPEYSARKERPFIVTDDGVRIWF